MPNPLFPEPLALPALFSRMSPEMRTLAPEWSVGPTPLLLRPLVASLSDQTPEKTSGAVRLT